jgi:hypothetical protein
MNQKDVAQRSLERVQIGFNQPRGIHGFEVADPLLGEINSAGRDEVRMLLFAKIQRRSGAGNDDS